VVYVRTVIGHFCRCASVKKKWRLFRLCTFNPVIVRWVRRSANLESLKDRLIRAGMLTIHQIVAKLGIDRSTVLAWRGNGRLNGRVCSDRGEWLYWLPDGRKIPSTRRTVTSPARGAV